MTHSYRLGLVTWKYQVRIPVGPGIFHRGCAYTVLKTVQRHGVYSGAYGTVHCKELLKSFRVGHSPGVGLSLHCIDSAKSHVKQYLLMHSLRDVAKQKKIPNIQKNLEVGGWVQGQFG